MPAYTPFVWVFHLTLFEHSQQVTTNRRISPCQQANKLALAHLVSMFLVFTVCPPTLGLFFLKEKYDCSFFSFLENNPLKQGTVKTELFIDAIYLFHSLVQALALFPFEREGLLPSLLGN